MVAYLVPYREKIGDSMNKVYEIEYHIDGHTLTRDVVTVDGRSARENRTPVSLIEYADKTARLWQADRYEIRLIKLAHITAAGVQPCVTHLVYGNSIEQ